MKICKGQQLGQYIKFVVEETNKQIQNKKKTKKKKKQKKQKKKRIGNYLRQRNDSGIGYAMHKIQLHSWRS